MCKDYYSNICLTILPLYSLFSLMLLINFPISAITVGIIESPTAIAQSLKSICTSPKILPTGGIITNKANTPIIIHALMVNALFPLIFLLKIDFLLRTVNIWSIDVHPTIKKAMVCPIIKLCFIPI